MRLIFCGRDKERRTRLNPAPPSISQLARRPALLLLTRLLLFGLAYCATVGELHAQRIEVDAGVGNYVDIVGVGFGTDDLKRWSIGGNWSISLYAMAWGAYWRGNAEHDLADLSVAPVVRLENRMGSAFAPYLEASIGLHLLSHTQINEIRQFSTAFQFGEFLGAGVAFGNNYRYNIALRVQHVSNGGIKNPNDGLTYGALVFQYQFPERESGADSK